MAEHDELFAAIRERDAAYDTMGLDLSGPNLSGRLQMAADRRFLLGLLARALVLTDMELDMLVAICEEGVDDWADETAVGLRRKILALDRA